MPSLVFILCIKILRHGPVCPGRPSPPAALLPVLFPPVPTIREMCLFVAVSSSSSSLPVYGFCLPTIQGGRVRTAIRSRLLARGSTLLPLPLPVSLTSHSLQMTINYNLAVSTSKPWTLFKLLLKWRGSIWKAVILELFVWLILYAIISIIYRTTLSPGQQR